MKPIIGIVEWPYYDKDNDKMYEVMMPLVEWVIRSGGRPIGIFPTQTEKFLDKKNQELEEMNLEELKDLRESLKMCDGIIKPGATRIYPHESIIYDMVSKENIPYLGICAGMQVMRNHCTPYVPNIKNDSDIEHRSNEEYAHRIHIERSTRLRSILDKESIMVNSKHSYHIPDGGVKTIAAYADDDVIEALEDTNKLFNIGVQWHPELLPDTDENSINLFGEFVECAKVYSKMK